MWVIYDCLHHGKFGRVLPNALLLQYSIDIDIVNPFNHLVSGLD